MAHLHLRPGGDDSPYLPLRIRYQYQDALRCRHPFQHPNGNVPWVFRPSLLLTCSETLTTAYAAEICPMNLRGLLASFVNMAWGVGIFIAVGDDLHIVDTDTDH